MIQTDSHLHTGFSSDSDTPMEAMITAATKKGLTSLCITEHYDPCFPENEENLTFSLDFEAYEQEFLRLKEIYQGKIHLYHGVELGVQPHISRECNEFYRTYGSRYDFIINSTHVVDRQDPYYGTYFSSFESGKKAIENYFETMLKNLSTFTEYQSVGHLDYICRYEPGEKTPFCYKDYQDILDAILLHIIAKDKSLEVNTAGWKYGMPDPNPNRQILKRYRELGGKNITLGSDGHKPEHLAYGFHRLPDFLRELGFTSYLFYKKKVPEEISL